MNYLEKLRKYKQSQLLRFEEELSKQEKQELINQIESLDFSYLNERKNADAEKQKIRSSRL